MARTGIDPTERPQHLTRQPQAVDDYGIPIPEKPPPVDDYGIPIPQPPRQPPPPVDDYGILILPRTPPSKSGSNRQPEPPVDDYGIPIPNPVEQQVREFTGETPPPGSIRGKAEAGKPIEVFNDKGGWVKLSSRQAEALAGSKGKNQFQMMKNLGILSKETEYVAGRDNDWRYVPDYAVKSLKSLEARRKQEELKKSFPYDIGKAKDAIRKLEESSKQAMGIPNPPGEVPGWLVTPKKAAKGEFEKLVLKATKKAVKEQYKKTRESPGGQRIIQIWREATPWKEEEGEKATPGGIATMAAELIVPYYYVTNRWQDLTPKERAISIGIDTVAVLLSLGIFALPGKLSGKVAELAPIATKAAKAGKAAEELDEAARILAKAKPKQWVKLSNQLAEAQSRSTKADAEFLSELGRVRELNPKQLSKLEKTSGFSNLKNVVTDIQKASDKLKKAQRSLEKIKPNFSKPAGKLSATQKSKNTLYIERLAKVREAQNELDQALSRAGSTLEPRYRPSPPADKFTGYNMAWKKANPKTPELKIKDSNLFDDIESYLARSREVKAGEKPWEMPKGKTTTKIKPTETATTGEYELKLKAKYAKPEPKPKTKPGKSAFPGIGKKPSSGISKGLIIPAEVLGRRTASQIAEEYGEDIEVISKPIEPTKIKPAQPEKVKPSIKPTEVPKLSPKPKPEPQPQPQPKPKPTPTEAPTPTEKQKQASGPDPKDQPVPKLSPKPKPEPQPQPQPKPKPTPTEEVPDQPTPDEPIPEKLKEPPKPIPGKVPIPKMGEEKEEKEGPPIKGAIGWQQFGESPGARFVVIKPPYNSKEDVLFLHDKPKGMRVSANKQSAFDTIQAIRGKIPDKLRVDMGFQDVEVKKDDKARPTITFYPDRQQTTRGNITLGSGRKQGKASMKKGKLFHTKDRKHKVVSRRPLRTI